MFYSRCETIEEHAFFNLLIAEFAKAENHSTMKLQHDIIYE